MTAIRNKAKLKRQFLPADLEIRVWSDIAPFAEKLLDTPIATSAELKTWLQNRSELDAVIEEDKAWLYIRQSCSTDQPAHAEAFAQFVNEIEEPFSKLNNQLNLKLLEYCSTHDYPEAYEIFIRGIRKETEIFREINVPILSSLEIEEQEYGSITGAMTIEYGGETLTLQQAQNYLKSINRNIRKEVFELIGERRQIDSDKLNTLFSKLLEKRQQLAVNAGFGNYLEYRFAQLGRFDYSIEDCQEFHKAVEKKIVPLLDRQAELRKQKLEINNLTPYDLDVDADGKEALKPFGSIKELVNKSISCYTEIDPQFGEFLSIMNEQGYLDLDSRKGKAPGGYNYPLHESNVPFIFMNATSNLRDLETMMHEGGHAIHAFLSKDLEFVYYKETPAEIAEVASMAMELISMEHWHHFFDNEDDLKRAKQSQLEGILNVLPWVATVDKFQHWLYSNPGHTDNERKETWLSIQKSLSSKLIDWTGYEPLRENLWQKQIHLYQFPLYYIEYGIAQLGAIGIWKNYKDNPGEALSAYKKALSLGYSKTLPELFKAAGVKFDFSAGYIEELVDFVEEELKSVS